MGIDKTQSAIEILKYFYENQKQENRVTISEVRKKILPRTRREEKNMWLKSKMNLDAVKIIIKLFLDLGFIRKDEKIKMKDKSFDSYRITERGIKLVEELKTSENLKELFAAILFTEVMKP
ncbi:MAG: hypothetical protein ISS48_04390 [Candidatus Aenigmarchaeota archaeon]|nr:hypothetical protein [Candidatus Aenigmarchaeota archaeon]